MICVALKEPSLDELLAEPIVRQLMQRDGVRPHEMRNTLEQVRQDRRQCHAAVL